MQYRLQFLDGLDNVLREMQADARSAGIAFLRGASIAWPPDAIRCACSTGVGALPFRRLGARKPPSVRRVEGRWGNDRIRRF